MDDVEVVERARLRALRTSPAARRSLPPPDPALLPPGPRLPRLVQSIGMMRFRHRFVPWLQRRHGDVFTVRLLPRGRTIVLVNEPEAVREVFAGDPDVFRAGEANSLLGPVMGEHSLLLLDGAEHRRARRLLTPAFSGKALRGYGELVTGLAKTEVGTWEAGTTVPALERMNALTLEVILRVVFGVTDESRLERLRPVVRATVEVSPAVFLGVVVPRLRRVGMWRRAAERAVELDRIIYEEIADRRTAGDLEHRTDVLSRLILADDGGDRLGDEELRDQLVTLLLAGHETTASALAWSLHELGRDPEQCARAREAARQGADEHLEAVVKEAMRLHPVIAMVVRVLRRPATIAGVELPAGATVAASIILAHRRGASHPDPGVFRPERFLAGAPESTAWIPFGGGVRRCIGAGFSLVEAVAVLREVLLRFDVEALGPERTRVRNISSVPGRGARIRLR